MSPLMRGALSAIASAVAFGATAPLIGHFGAGLGAWSVAALLYLGAALATRPTMRPAARERAIATRDLGRIAACGIFGAMLAPAALAWGIAHTGALSASLVLALESVFTIAIAAFVFREHVAPRVTIAATLIAAGAIALIAGTGGGSIGALGIAAVAAATLLWAIDNAITGTIAGADPSSVVVVKSTIGVAGSIAVALLLREPLPPLEPAIALLATGAIGFGASLRWYLLAQRTFGVARTASLFAIAPFVGAAIAFALGERAVSVPAFSAAAVLIALGIALHLSERHEHRHRHTRQRHVHAHTHDDGHHDQVHAALPDQPHSHDHVHATRVHVHPHAPDEHHAHTHDGVDDPHHHEHPDGQAFGTPKPS
jgi:drug/metabolite transporter (DMT)-like permease